VHAAEGEESREELVMHVYTCVCMYVYTRSKMSKCVVLVKSALFLCQYLWVFIVVKQITGDLIHNR